MNFESSPKQNTENSPENFVELGTQEALEEIKINFENRENEIENLPFHNSLHTERVIGRVGLILAAIEEANPELITENIKNLGEIAASRHDIVQKWEEKETPDGQFVKVIRKRFTGENEKESGDNAVSFMEKANTENNAKIFSEEDENIVREAIETTIPGYNPEKSTVVQPNLSAKSSIVAKALALADIGAAGINGPMVFSEEGDAVFKEENLDILRASKNHSDIPEDLKEYYRQRMTNWSNSQISFAQGRKELLERELNGLPEQSQKKLKELFNKFDASIRIAGQRAEKREKMTFEDLLVDMKFN